CGVPYHKVDPLELDMALVTRTLSRPFALRHAVLPLRRDAEGLVVALEDPFARETIAELERIAQAPVRCEVASKREIFKALTEIYGFRQSVESAARESSTTGLADFEQLVKLRSVGEIEASDQHVVNAVDFLLRYAFDQRASDIHIEPRRGDTQVRLRIDGVLHDAHHVPRRVHGALLSRIKTIARLDIAEKRRPQDGRIKMVMAEREIELRVSTMPVAFGEKAVLRIFDPGRLLQDLGDLGFDADEEQRFARWLSLPHGMVLVTGPTGSGKTTTLYTALQALASTEVNVTSVEDPIEMVTDRFNQVAVQSRIGVDFASALRTILRQDPDVIMVGEIRDSATAEMAVQAALTGHLVLSTLHTNDAVGAVTRLRDLDVPPFLIGSTLVGVLAQRLLRRLCPECTEPAPLTADQRMALAVPAAAAADFNETAAGRGCVACRGTGYHGRLGIFEMMEVDSTIAQRVAQSAPESELHALAERQGMRSLRQSALARLRQGKTSFEEVMRVTGAGRA
ncbi:MAG: GspE/PulE family protein, partial [Myxococcota bacterium]